MINTKQYQSANVNWQQTTMRLINEFDEKLINMSGKCMDIGCGPGDITRNILLPALDPKAIIIGTDKSKDMIKYAKELHSDEERLEFEILDIETKNLPDKYVSEFDHAFSFHALHWCDDIRQAIENIYRLLRPGGSFLAVMVISHDIYNILYKMAQDVRYASYVTKMNKFLPPFYGIPQPDKEMKKLLRSIGFIINHCSYRERISFYKDVQVFPTAMMSFIPLFLENMPDNLMQEFRDEFTREFMRRTSGRPQLHNNEETTSYILDGILIFHAQKNNE